MPRLNKILRFVRNFLFAMLNKEFLIFLFFLAVSGVFWLLMTLNETYEKELPVVVRLTGVPRNVVVTSDLADTVHVTVRDKGFTLLSYTTSNSLRPLSISFAGYANKQTGHGVVPASDLQRLVRQQLFASTVVTAVKADKLDFYFNYGRHKEAKVRLSGNIVPASNYYLSHVRFSPERVTVYASGSKLDSIAEVNTEFLNIVGFTEQLSRTVRLRPMTGVKFVPDTVRVTLYPDVLTEQSVEVPITAINLPAGMTIRTFPQRVKVHFSVGASMFRLVRSGDFQVVVDYKEVAARPSDKCSIHLFTKPRIVSNARLDIERVDYLIEQ